ncbi:MAG: hypothetical protein AAF533_13590 [Acidobacteriota bacterium]
MNRHDDVLAFLASDEEMSARRHTVSPATIDRLREEHSDIPEDYLAYLREVGCGDHFSDDFTLFGGLVPPDEIFDAESAAELGGILCFGSYGIGDIVGFLPGQGWKVVEIEHVLVSAHDVERTFGELIRELLGMDEPRDTLGP